VFSSFGERVVLMRAEGESGLRWEGGGGERALLGRWRIHLTLPKFSRKFGVCRTS
jgi:hypothetical protein